MHTHTHTHTHLQDIVNTIQESWDADSEARLSAHCIYMRLVTFTTKYYESDSGFPPSEVDHKVSAWWKLCMQMQSKV